MIRRFADDYPNDVIYYRYDLAFTTNNLEKIPELVMYLRKFVVMKRFKSKTVVIHERLNTWDLSSTKRRIKLNSKNKYAYPTKLEAIRDLRKRINKELEKGREYVTDCKKARTLAKQELVKVKWDTRKK